ncbi:maleate cis-trans isomerase family protein [Halostreptopolyspora alba]|uniref:Maleate cis-trans isomerase n=1 Tax=Halostreptopolyspora alba TaxID=2487137 RepID=A0A3N0ED85_9ACTN|nr:maleate cis-trans isomerase [Nocardiopsaceae bacterium YIM 96095]
MTVAGFLYPGHSAEDDYPELSGRLGSDIDLRVVHTLMREDAHRVDALLDVGGADVLAEGARELRELGADSVVWACTSGSFVFGWDGAREQVAGVREVAGTPASSTSFAFVNAARHLGLRRVAVAASYPDDVTSRFAEFLGEGGVEVVAIASRDIITAAEVGHLTGSEVLEFVSRNDDASAEGILVPDTALHTAGILDDLEDRVGKPVLTANQVSVWEGLRLAGVEGPYEGLGSLFRVDAPAGTVVLDD